MQTIIFGVYYIILLLATIIGILLYRRLDTALRFIVILLILTVMSETTSYILVELEEYGVRYSMFHIYSILQLILITLFFIYATRPFHYRKQIAITIFACPLIGVLNIVFFQPIDKLNTNMLMLECLIINTMSLYFIYWLIKHSVQNLFKSSHFQITLTLLVLWSSTFFFWGLIPVLDDDNWAYINIIGHIHAITNIVVYGCIALIIYYYPKKRITHGYN